MHERVSRRQVVAGSVALITAGLAGCSDEDDGDDDDNSTDDGGAGGGGY